MKFVSSNTSRAEGAVSAIMSGRPTTRPAQAVPTYESHFEHTAPFEFSNVINSSLDLKFILSHILLTIMGKILSTKGMVVLEKTNGKYAVEMLKGFPSELRKVEFTIKRIPRSLFHIGKLNV